MSIPDDLIQKAKRAPLSPGCYLWKDDKGELIYIGKALNLKKRIASYLRPLKGDGVKNRVLKLKIRELDWIVTESESEALLLEDNLIKKHLPIYNIRLKDDKRYPYLCLTMGEEFPRLFMTRKEKSKKHLYFGPYTSVKSIRMTLNLIHKLFPLRKKNLKLPLSSPGKPCLNFHIGRCLAPCSGEVSRDEYATIVNHVVLFLEGKHNALNEELYRQMQTASNNLEFEKAARLRDTYEAIKSIKRKTYIQSEVGSFDVMHFARRDTEAELVILEFREGKLAGKKNFPISLVDFQELSPALSTKKISSSKEDEKKSATKIKKIDEFYRDIMESGLREYYGNQTSLPVQQLYIPYRLPEAKMWENYLAKKHSCRFSIKRPSAGSKKSLLGLAKKNANLLLSERLLQVKAKDKREALSSLQSILQLNKIPRIMECYDISHFQGVEPVASGVFFKDGKPHKSSYRRYIMKGYAPGDIDDPGMIHEVISRRMEYLSNEKLSLPDLIIIDGGKTQLEAAVEALELFSITTVAIISLAKKREEIFLPYQENPLVLPRDHKALLLLQSIRDEAHRFAVTFHKKRRDKRTLSSVLDNINGLGDDKKKKVLLLLSDVDDLADLSIQDLQGIRGIGSVLAKKILEQYKK